MIPYGGFKYACGQGRATRAVEALSAGPRPAGNNPVLNPSPQSVEIKRLKQEDADHLPSIGAPGVYWG